VECSSCESDTGWAAEESVPVYGSVLCSQQPATEIDME